MSLIDKKISLMPIKVAHYPLLFSLWNNQKLIQYTYHQFTETLAAAENRIEKIMAYYKNADKASGPFLIYDGPTFIGYCGMDARDTSLKSFEIWYIISAEHQGKGYGSNAAQILTEIAFNQLDAAVVNADVVGINTASVKILENIGFKHSQELPSMFDRNGIVADLLKYSISKEDWLSLH